MDVVGGVVVVVVGSVMVAVVVVHDDVVVQLCCYRWVVRGRRCGRCRCAVLVLALVRLQRSLLS